MQIWNIRRTNGGWTAINGAETVKHTFNDGDIITYNDPEDGLTALEVGENMNKRDIAKALSAPSGRAASGNIS